MLDSVRSALLSQELQETWKSSIALWENPPEGKAEELLSSVRRLRDEFLELVETVEDADEIVVALAVRYIEIKSQWIQLNTHVNYQMFRHGEASEELMHRAALLSQLLAAIEPLIGQEDLHQITHFLAQPVQPRS